MLTPATLDDPAKFFEHLRGVAVQGFAIDVEECEAGLCCAAAPVFDGQGSLAAALSISGPRARLSDQRLLGEIVPLVVGAAEQLSRELGFVHA
jgi:IclR family acetate operon transcriptional repressor